MRPNLMRENQPRKKNWSRRGLRAVNQNTKKEQIADQACLIRPANPVVSFLHETAGRLMKKGSLKNERKMIGNKRGTGEIGIGMTGNGRRRKGRDAAIKEGRFLNIGPISGNFNEIIISGENSWKKKKRSLTRRKKKSPESGSRIRNRRTVGREADPSLRRQKNR